MHGYPNVCMPQAILWQAAILGVAQAIMGCSAMLDALQPDVITLFHSALGGWNRCHRNFLPFFLATFLLYWVPGTRLMRSASTVVKASKGVETHADSWTNTLVAAQTKILADALPAHNCFATIKRINLKIKEHRQGPIH